MSLVKARMAKIGFLSFVHRTGCVAGFGVVVSFGPLQAQENVFRVSSIRLQSVTIAPPQRTPVDDKRAEVQNASNPSEEVIRPKFEESSVPVTGAPQTGAEQDQIGRAHV